MIKKIRPQRKRKRGARHLLCRPVLQGKGKKLCMLEEDDRDLPSAARSADNGVTYPRSFSRRSIRHPIFDNPNSTAPCPTVTSLAELGAKSGKLVLLQCSPSPNSQCATIERSGPGLKRAKWRNAGRACVATVRQRTQG